VLTSGVHAKAHVSVSRRCHRSTVPPWTRDERRPLRPGAFIKPPALRVVPDFEETYPKFKPLLKAVEEFRTYIVNNRHLIPNYGERYRHGEAIATGFVESTVNQVVSKRCCKKQQMQWSKRGAHLLLQTRVKTLNHELGTGLKRWYPDMEVEELPDAA
jgi:hypothetical protein